MLAWELSVSNSNSTLKECHWGSVVCFLSQKLALNSFFQLRTRGVTKEQKHWTGTDPGTNTQLAVEPSLRQPLVQGCARPAGHPASHSLRPAGNSTLAAAQGTQEGTCSTAPPTGFSRLHPVPATDGGLLLTSAENNPGFHLPGFNLLTNQGPSCEGVGLLLVAKTKAEPTAYTQMANKWTRKPVMNLGCQCTDLCSLAVVGYWVYSALELYLDSCLFFIWISLKSDRIPEDCVVEFILLYILFQSVPARRFPLFD